MKSSDLTIEEQKHVRAALRFLHARCDGWAPLGKVLHMKHLTVAGIANGAPVTASVAFRVARLACVTVDDVVAGRFPPPGTCPRCGHREEPQPPA